MSTADYHLSMAIEEAVGEFGQRPLGRLMGIAHNTIAAHGSSLSSWPSDQLLRLSDISDTVRGALIARIEGTQPRTGATTERASMITSRDAGEVVRDLIDALTDGRINPREARRSLTGVRKLLADLRGLETSLLERAEAKS